MATASWDLSEEQFLCCICLDVFTDPVTAPCGHNFCKSCICRHWSDARPYKCPCCKKMFPHKPALHVNTLLCEMVRLVTLHTRRHDSGRLAAGPGDVACDVCPQPRLKALKSCLVCLTSFCESHLQPHLSAPGLKRHQLSAPIADLSRRLCEEHHKVLELFCRDEQLCVCALCSVGEHRGHELLSLSQASQELSLGAAENMAERIHTLEEKVLELRRSMHVSNNEADREVTRCLEVLNDLRAAVDRSLDKLVKDFARKRKTTEEQALNVIRETEREITELKKRQEHLTEPEDHLRFLQNLLPLGSAPQTEDGSEFGVSPPTYEGAAVRALSELEQEFRRTTRGLFEEHFENIRKYQVFVELDRETAHPQLSVSDCSLEVRPGSGGDVVDGPGRFDKGLYVLGTDPIAQSFYFEVEVKGKPEWTLGVARESVTRKGPIVLSPKDGFWAVSLSCGAYFASDGTEVPLQTKCRAEMVGVFVNYSEGLVSFYDAKVKDLIYSFSDCSFTQKLFPLLGPGHDTFENSAPLVLSVKEFVSDPWSERSESSEISEISSAVSFISDPPSIFTDDD